MRINIINKKTYVEGRETVRILRAVPSTKRQWQSNDQEKNIYYPSLLIITQIIHISNVEDS